MSIQRAQYSVMEGDTLSVTVSMNSKASKDVMVEVTLTSGSANGGNLE